MPLHEGNCEKCLKICKFLSLTICSLILVNFLFGYFDWQLFAWLCFFSFSQKNLQWSLNNFFLVLLRSAIKLALSELSLTELIKSTTLLPVFQTIWLSFHTSLTKPSSGILTSLLIKKAAMLMMKTIHGILSFLLLASTLE